MDVLDSKKFGDDIKISLFASAIRTRLWSALLDSLKSTTEEYEVVFAGPLNLESVPIFLSNYPCLRFIKTENIKPAQCYEVARRACAGETISWIADDCEFSEDCYGKAYRYWKSMGNDKVALSIQTVEDGYRYKMEQHSYVGFNENTPLMAPVCLMSRDYLNQLGGLDRRFQCGQYENEICCRIHADGGGIIIFKDGECYINHSKHGKEHNFRIGYSQDRKVLENSWGKIGEAIKIGRLDKFEPYENKDLLVRSQCLTLKSIWE